MYTQSITRNHRTAFILLIDGSGSMTEELRFRGRTTSKAEAVAAITNDLLFELIERARRDDGVRDYYDIAVLGYSGNDEVKSLLPGRGELLSVTQLAALDVPVRRELVEHRLPDGGIALREIPSREEADYPNRYAALLYDCSSEMPAIFEEAIREAKGPAALPPFRGMSYNASAAELVAMLNIGSVSVKTE